MEYDCPGAQFCLVFHSRSPCFLYFLSHFRRLYMLNLTYALQFGLVDF
jgi:hypothetical protein